MGTIARAYSVANILQGPVDVYVGITVPASSTHPLADTHILTLDSNGQPTSSTGQHIGSVEGPSQLQITEKSNEIMDDQHESPIDIGFNSTEAEIDVIMKETSLTRLNTVLTTAVGAYNALSNSKVLQLGGKFDSAYTPTTLLLVSPDRSTSGKFFYVLAYKCFLKAAIQMSFQRSKESTYKLKFGAVCDLTRQAGDELMQIVRTK